MVIDNHRGVVVIAIRVSGWNCALGYETFLALTSVRGSDWPVNWAT